MSHPAFFHVTFMGDRGETLIDEPHARKSDRPAAMKAAAQLSTTKPYDPLDLKTLAESMVKVVLEQPVHPLGDIPTFDGAGVYVIYYTGDYQPYKSIAQKNVGSNWGQPIYVGEAARKGARKGGVLAEGPAGRVLFSRLRNHADSIRGVVNLKLEHFWCTYLSMPRSMPDGCLR